MGRIPDRWRLSLRASCPVRSETFGRRLGHLSRDRVCVWCFRRFR